MKRTIVVLCVAALLVGLAFSHEALAGKGGNGKGKGPAPKVKLCHVTDSVVVNAAGVSLVIGHVISVSENAEAAHVAHGDILKINDIDSAGPFNLDQTWRDIAEIWLMDTTDANCAGFRLP